MIHFEKKLDAVMRCLAGETHADREQARKEISQMLAAQDAPPAERGVGDEVRRILTEIGVPDHILGHRYLVCAITLVVENPELLEYVTGRLYPEVAKACGTTKNRAERAIRHGIELSWERCDLDTMIRYFGSTVDPQKGRPTNSEFIARISNVVRQSV